MEKKQEKYENMDKMMIQIDLLTNHVMGSSKKTINVVITTSGVNGNESHFESMYNEEV